ncbi:MAG: alpha/beta hydrolase [Sphingomonadales bacterium]
MPIVRANNIDLFYKDRGAPDAPVILLIMGLGTQLTAWPKTFVKALKKAGFRVIRYDNRDIGKSTHLHDAPSPNLLWAMAAKRFGLSVPLGYSLDDMADDAVALMDELGIPAAHVVGASMGGMIAQIMAAKAPERVLSLTSIMSSSGAPGLPGPALQVRKALLAPRSARPPRATATARRARTLELVSFPDAARKPDAFRSMAERDFDRAYNPMGTRRQLLAIIADGSRADRLARVQAPTLVVHGAADPLIPLACSEDIVRRIPGARLEVIDEMAHDLPPSQMPRLAELIVGHARSAEELRRAA